jgi:hypothetical protein
VVARGVHLIVLLVLSVVVVVVVRPPDLGIKIYLQVFLIRRLVVVVGLVVLLVLSVVVVDHWWYDSRAQESRLTSSYS